MLEILCRAPVIPAPFEVHSEFGGDFADVVSIKVLEAVPDSPVHLDASRRRHSFIQHVLIQGMSEAIPCHDLSSGGVNHTCIVNELMLTS
jgi:hypothetical protein